MDENLSRTTGPRAGGHLPLSAPVFQILLSLADRDLHGYAIIQDIRHRTADEVRLTASTLYAAIKRLLAGGLIEELDERPDPALDDARRRYYRITAFGREVASLEAARLERLTAMAREKRLLPDPAGPGSAGRP
jgi:DNA-binding PadR family transcriptional regulator